MACHVFANGLEVASKCSTGKSVAAFPDICLSPPSPPAGPAPLPYPNTSEAKNLDKGSGKVLIKNKMIGLEGKSCFSKSMGNEPATQGLGKGVITHTLQGKAYFQKWSMDVKVEGKGVPRHLDLTTHNHASQPGETPPMVFLAANAANYRSNYDPGDAEIEGNAIVFQVHHVVEKNDGAAQNARDVLWGTTQKTKNLLRGQNKAFAPKQGSAGIHINAPVNLVGLPSKIKINGSDNEFEDVGKKKEGEEYGIIHKGSHPRAYSQDVETIVQKAWTDREMKDKGKVFGHSSLHAAEKKIGGELEAWHGKLEQEGRENDDVKKLAVAVALRRIAVRLLTAPRDGKNPADEWGNVLAAIKSS